MESLFGIRIDWIDWVYWWIRIDWIFIRAFAICNTTATFTAFPIGDDATFVAPTAFNHLELMEIDWFNLKFFVHDKIV